MQVQVQTILDIIRKNHYLFHETALQMERFVMGEEESKRGKENIGKVGDHWQDGGLGINLKQHYVTILH